MQNTIRERIFPITGKIFSSPYDWGGNELIPKTLGFEPESGVPYAEYWIGTHDKAPAQVSMPDGSTKPLNELVRTDAQAVLGNKAATRFGTLPFLFKLLDAGEMLSIQVHPNKKQAEEGFSREEQLGIPLNDPKRTYKDNNLKSEFAIALGDFWLLHGFRQKESLQHILNEVKEFAPLVPYFADGDYKKLYQYVMRDMNADEANTILKSLAERVVPAFESGKLQQTSPDYWTARAIMYMKMHDGAYDRGIFSIYFLNLVNMKPGQSIFQSAGVLHAYLQGPIIEVMTTSDNVARGGITPKYVDIEELLKLVLFEGVTPNVQEVQQTESEATYTVPIDEFMVSRIQPTATTPYKTTSYSAEILMGIDGNATITASGKTLPIGKGKSVLVLADTTYEITGSETDIVYKTSVPKK